MENFFLAIGCFLLAAVLSGMIIGMIEVVISIFKTTHTNDPEE